MVVVVVVVLAAAVAYRVGLRRGEGASDRALNEISAVYEQWLAGWLAGWLVNTLTDCVGPLGRRPAG